MQLRPLLASFLFPLALLSSLHAAQKPSPLTANAAENLRNEVMAQIQAKFDQGANTAADFAPELKKLDQHAARYAEYPDLVADFAMVKVALYLDGLNDLVEGRKMLVALSRDYPGTPAAEQAALALVKLDQTAKRDANLEDLAPWARQVTAKADAGSRTEAEFAAELAQLDALITKYADNREAAADLVLAKALLYLRVLKDPVKASQHFLALTTEYRGTLAAASAEEILAGFEEASKR
jgi:hypothetical protein